MYTITVINADTGETNELSTTDTSFKVVDLKPYMKYHFSVAASTAAGIGPSTQNLSLTTAEDCKTLYCSYLIGLNKSTMLKVAFLDDKCIILCLRLKPCA